ncbi:DUF2795 domain-containing protein [Rubrobacter xylanophilus]|uniref:DUF2795 domain-containing protein n=1 Tax=Rubrobacter xylanophilus TaxID=49319 RepID=UPI00117AC1CF
MLLPPPHRVNGTRKATATPVSALGFGSHSEVQKHLKDAGWPASKEDLASTTGGDGALEDFVEWLSNLPAREYTGPETCRRLRRRAGHWRGPPTK